MTDHKDDAETTQIRATEVWSAQTHGNKANAYLIVVGGRSLIGKAYKIDNPMVIGRGERCDIVLEDEGVSRKHARIHKRRDGAIELSDLESTNGTFCNGLKITSHLLNDGDKIQIGSTAILKFSYQDALDEQLQKNLFEMGTRDGLTRLYNKAFLTDALQKEFVYAARHSVPLSVVMLDIDHFKTVNDTYGHVAGDYVLQRVAQRVAETVREEDILARYGGEELIALLRETPEDEGMRCAERIRRVVENGAFLYNDHTIPVTLSGGVATLVGNSYATAEELIAAADKHLYLAKQRGRNRIVGRLTEER